MANAQIKGKGEKDRTPEIPKGMNATTLLPGLIVLLLGCQRVAIANE